MSASVRRVAIGACLVAGSMSAACATTRRSGGADPEHVGRSEIARCRFDPVASGSARPLDGLAGTYRLVMTSDADPEIQTRGRLQLAPAPDVSRGMGAAPVLVGTTDIDASIVGAIVPGPASSEDPGAPGVGVYAFPERPGSAVTMAVLRLGSEANRRDRQRFDGAHATLRITARHDDRFGGSWTSAEGAVERSGGFCAIRR
jgi:hypothetical protein